MSDQPSGDARSVALSSDGLLAAVGADNGEVWLWKTDTGELLRRTRLFSNAPADQRPRNIGAVRSLSFRADNRQVLALCSGFVAIWDVQSGNESLAFGPVSATEIAACPDGRHVATGGENFKEKTADLQLWDLETRQHVRSFNGQAGSVLCFSPDGRQLLSGGTSLILHLWNVETGDEIRRFTVTPIHYSRGVLGVAFSPDGKSIAAAGHGVISVFDPETGEELARCTGEIALSAQRAGFMNDGRHLLSSGAFVAKWDITSPSFKDRQR